MKKCPYCAEEIQDEAVVCRHCGRDLTNPGKYKKKKTWIGGIAFVIFSISLAAMLISGDLNSPWLWVMLISVIIVIIWLITGRIKYLG